MPWCERCRKIEVGKNDIYDMDDDGKDDTWLCLNCIRMIEIDEDDEREMRRMEDL